jgi:hypothetical protein
MPRLQNPLQRPWDTVTLVVPCLVSLYAVVAKCTFMWIQSLRACADMADEPVVKDVVEDARLAPSAPWSPVRPGTVSPPSLPRNCPPCPEPPLAGQPLHR